MARRNSRAALPLALTLIMACLEFGGPGTAAAQSREVPPPPRFDTPLVNGMNGGQERYTGARTRPGEGQGALPPIVRDAGIDQRLNDQVPLDLEFTDDAGRVVRLGEYAGKRPIVLALVYFGCPMLCNQVLNGLTSSLKVLKLEPGKDFEVVVASFNPNETPTLAAAKRANYLKDYGRPGTDAGWHFLTGSQTSILHLTSAVGFRYVWDEPSKQYVHASAIMLLTPEGKLSRYFYGVEYSPKDMRLGLIEASQNRIGTVVDQVLLYCYHYDPATGKYSVVAMNVLRLAGILTVLAIVTYILVSLRREPARKVEPLASASTPGPGQIG